jgi:hypothetical protein
MSECPRGFHHVNQVCPRAFPRRMLTMKNGTHSAMQTTSASAMAVEISMAQLLPVLGVFVCKLRSSRELVLGAASRDEDR